MVRRVLVVVMAIIVSHLLVALSGYLLYTFSVGRSEARLSLMVRLFVSPAIAVLTGVLVGLSSKDRPVLLAVLGLAPWILNLFGPEKPGLAWLGSSGVYIALGAIAAGLVFQFRRRDEFANLTTVSRQTQ